MATTSVPVPLDQFGASLLLLNIDAKLAELKDRAMVPAAEVIDFLLDQRLILTGGDNA